MRARPVALYVVLATLLVAVAALALLLGQGSLRDADLARTLLVLRATRVGAAFVAGGPPGLGGGGGGGGLPQPPLPPRGRRGPARPPPRRAPARAPPPRPRAP